VGERLVWIIIGICHRGLVYRLQSPFPRSLTHTTVLRLSGFVRDNPVEPLMEETCTHSHLSWSSVIPYLLHLLWSMAFLLFSLCEWSVFFHNLSPSFLLVYLLAWHPPLQTPLLFSFRCTRPYHRNLFCSSTEKISSNPSLSLNPLLGLYLVASCHTSI